MPRFALPRFALPRLSVIAIAAAGTLSGCAPSHFMPRPGMDATNQLADEAGCRLYTRGQEHPLVFAAAGSPRFVGASMLGAAIGHGIGEAIEASENFADCMEVKGYVPVQPAPVGVVTAAATPAQPQPAPASVIAAQTVIESEPDAISEIRAVDLNPLMATALKIPSRQGAYVTGIDRAGKAPETDLQPGDVILDFGGKPVRVVDDLQRQLAHTHVHATVQARVRRDNTIRYVSARF